LELAIQGTSVVQGANAKQALAWTRYKSCLSSIGLSHDWFLDSFTSCQKNHILSAYAHAHHEGRLSFSKTHNTFKSESARATLDCVAQTYKLAERPDPRLDCNK
jgi:hypothetical protein